MNEPKFIKAEFLGAGVGSNFKYYWECSMCGETYTTKLATNTSGLCEDCKNKVWQREIKERRERAEKKAYKKIMNAIKESNFSSSDIPSITLNGDKYYKAKDLEEAYKALVDKCIEEENERGGEDE